MAALPFDIRDGFIWMDGRLQHWRDAKVHYLTHGLHYGSCVFEGQRVYNGKVFALEEHTARLFRSAELLDMRVPFTQAEINNACRQVVDAAGLKDAYMRPAVWRGSNVMGVSAQASDIRVAVAVWPWPSYFSPEERAKGIRLTLAKWKRPSPETIPCEAKAAGLYMICTLSKHEAERDGYSDAMMLDYRGYVAEATGANIFFVKNDKIYTPTPDCFLNGITRQTVIRLARERQLEVIEKHIKPEELDGFEQCFLTGSAAEVTPVSEIGDWKFAVGDITKTLMEDYAMHVRGMDT
ncbi:MAG TPA: branched-chain amino acid aminotransferase [Alphaproteobacteria bacterium]|nr:branched-chain amino acid aminotransferase [Alphaproteobacteria bacterium]HAJ45681.1 branched-chain amino acid aminotransferase [Alphaproteobacteria bacterium]